MKAYRWFHVNLKWENPDILMYILETEPSIESNFYRRLMEMVNHIISGTSNCRRFFFDFNLSRDTKQDEPDFFLALELSSPYRLNRLNGYIHKAMISYGDIGARFYLTDSNDEGNGEAALDFFHASAKFALYRVGKEYINKYSNNNEIKLIHMFCNQMGLNWTHERIFYYKCLQHRALGIKEIYYLRKLIRGK